MRTPFCSSFFALHQVVAGAGAVDHAQLVDLAGQAFSELPSGGPSTEELVKKVCWS